MAPRSKLLRGDCLRVLRSIPSHSVDMILSDLPYGTTQCEWDSVLCLDSLWAEYRRVAKPSAAIVLFSQSPFDKVLAASNLRDFRYEWIWEKCQGTGHLNANRAPLKKHENILVFYRRQSFYRPQLAPGQPYISTSGRRSENYGSQVRVVTRNAGHRFPTTLLRFKRDPDRHHPTQKPVALCEYLIRTYTKRGQTVLDSCMGSGTTGVAASRTGRHFIGIEKLPKYVTIARARIRAARPDTSKAARASA